MTNQKIADSLQLRLRMFLFFKLKKNVAFFVVAKFYNSTDVYVDI